MHLDKCSALLGMLRTQHHALHLVTHELMPIKSINQAQGLEFEEESHFTGKTT